MDSVSEIRATGRDIDGNIVQWVVAIYADSQEAYKHHQICLSFLEDAKAGLPPMLSYREREDAMRWLQPAHDPQYAIMQAFDVTYSLDAYPVRLTAPAPERVGNAWRAMDATSAAALHLADGIARQFIRDEEIEGTAPGPLPSKTSVSRNLWLIGVDPGLPAVNGFAGETGADAFYRIFGAAVEQRRYVLRERSRLAA